MTIMALPMQLFAPMRYRLVEMIAVIVILSASAVLADFSDDFRTVNEVDRNPAVRVRDSIEVHSLDGSLTPAQLDDFADLAEKGAGDIARFTGVTPRKQRILIYLSPRIDISHTYPHYPGSLNHEARVFIDSERVYYPLAGDGEIIDRLLILNAYPGNPSFDALTLPALPASRP